MEKINNEIKEILPTIRNKDMKFKVRLLNKKFLLGKKIDEECLDMLEKNVRGLMELAIDSVVLDDDKRNPFAADKKNPMKHCYQNEGYNKAIDDIEKKKKSFWGVHGIF